MNNAWRLSLPAHLENQRDFVLNIMRKCRLGGMRPMTNKESPVNSFIEECRKKRRQSIIEDGESFRESEIYCPHCAEILKDGVELIPNRAGEEEEAECESCENRFLFSWEALFSSRKLEAEGGDDGE